VESPVESPVESTVEPSLEHPEESKFRTPLPPPRLCKLPVIGALWIPLGLVVPAMYLMLVRVEPGNTGSSTYINPGEAILKIFLLGIGILGFFSPFGSTLLGWIGISRIKNSGGRLHGLPLSLGVSIFYPLLALDLILCTAIYFLVGESVKEEVLLASLAFFAVLLYLYIFWVFVRTNSRPGSGRGGEGMRCAGFTLLALGLFLVSMTLIGILETYNLAEMNPTIFSRRIARSLVPSALGVPSFILGGILLLVSFRASKSQANPTAGQ